MELILFNILALTFYQQSRQRNETPVLQKVVGENAKSLWMGTFHSVFARILRSEAHYLGFFLLILPFMTRKILSMFSKSLLKDLKY